MHKKHKHHGYSKDRAENVKVRLILRFYTVLMEPPCKSIFSLLKLL